MKCLILLPLLLLAGCSGVTEGQRLAITSANESAPIVASYAEIGLRSLSLPEEELELMLIQSHVDTLRELEASLD
jgi:hypothetical protein